jgi:hypothetical protein
MGTGAIVVGVVGEPQNLWSGTPGPDDPRLLSDRRCRMVEIIADEDNAGVIVIGPGPNVRATAAVRRGGIALVAGQRVAYIETDPSKCVDMAELYVDATVAGNWIRWSVYNSITSMRTSPQKQG